MANWRERGYVPDSDEEEEEDTAVDLTAATASPREKESACLRPENNSPTLKASDFPLDVDDNPTKQQDEPFGDFIDNGSLLTVTGPSLHTAPQAGATYDANMEKMQTSHVSAEELGLSLSPRNISLSTAAQLEAEIQKGLQTLQDVLGSRPNHLESEDGSPLSSLPSSMCSSPRRISSPQVNPGLASEAGELVDIDGDHFLPDVPFVTPRRAFRPRAPIQVHPYALEDARYRQTLRDRGMRPVRLPEAPLNVDPSLEGDSQGTDAYQSSQLAFADEQILPLSPIQAVANDESQSPIRGSRIRPAAPELNSDDDLPDLSDVLRNKAMALSTRVRKKVPRAKRRLSIDGDQYRVYDLPDEDEVDGHPPERSNDWFIVPPSPPRSYGVLSSQDGGRIDNLQDPGVSTSTPEVLPTPLVSSDKHGSKRRYIEVPSSSDSDENSATDDQAPTSPESSDDETQGVHRMQRKIKGVLPASWLRLDKNQQKGGQNHRSHQRSPVKNALEKGIAQRVSNSAIKDRRRDPLDARQGGEDLYTSSESDTAEVETARAVSVDYDMRHALEDDVVEEDVVDAMLARAPKATSSRNRQQKLTDVGKAKRTMKAGKKWSKGDHARAGGGRSLAPRSKKRTNRPRKKLMAKHKGLQMTILDAPGFRDEDVPVFLRIASRRSAVLGDARRQDPSNKFLKLATMRDTLDVNEELRRWRAHQGEVHNPHEDRDELTGRVALDMRQYPVDDISEEVSASIANKAGGQLTSLKRSTNNTLERIRSHQVQTRLPRSESATSVYTRPPALLGYFKPRGPRRRNFPDSRRPTVDSGNEVPDSETTEVVLTQPVPLLRRIPKPPRKRQPRADQSLPPRSDPSRPQRTSIPSRSPKNTALAPTSPAIQPARPSKKQRPLPLTARMENGPDQQTLRALWSPGLHSLNLDDDEEIISFATNHPPGTVFLRGNSTLQGSALVHDGLLQTTESSMADVGRLLQPNTSGTQNTASGSQETVLDHGWSAQIEGAVDEIAMKLASIFHDQPESTHSPPNEDVLLTEVAQSVENIINSLNSNLPFFGPHELKAFIDSLFAKVDKLVSDFASSDRVTIQQHASSFLRILNRLMILSYQIDRIAMFLGAVKADLDRISETRKKVSNLSLQLALRKEQVVQLFRYIAVETNSQSVVQDSPVEGVTSEIEAIVLVHKLGPHQPWKLLIDNVLSSYAETETSEVSPTDVLALAILILACILSAIRASELIAPATETCPLFDDMLTPALSDFLKFFVKKQTSSIQQPRSKGPDSNKLRQFGHLAFKWCLIFAHSFQPGVAETLLKQMFKHYSDKTNNMLDFFSPMSSKTPRFLDALTPPSELVPVLGDTDFHLFLKLAALTLQIPQTFDSDSEVENEERLRKIKVRKQSLLFSLLPNKGHDTGADMQLVVEEHESLSLRDLGAVANRYILISTLFHYSPAGCKPEISHIRDLVEFGVAHDEIRTVILQCWASIAKSITSQPTSTTGLQQLAEWIQDMFDSIFDKMKEIPWDNGSLHEVVGSAEAHAHRSNRETANIRLCKIAKAYDEALDHCHNQGQVTMLLGEDQSKKLILRCKPTDRPTDVLLVRIFEIVTTYVKKGLSTPSEQLARLRADIKGVLADQLITHDTVVHDDSSLIAMTETWFTIAKVMVDAGNNSWDHFLNPWATFAFPQIAHGRLGRHCHYLLMSKVAVDRTVVVQDLHFFLDEWIKAILSPDESIKFQHLLTNQLMESAPDILGLKELRASISNGPANAPVYRQDLINHRREIVRHIIKTVYDMQTMDDASLIGTLSKSNAVRLLTTMTSTMKQTWNSLEQDSRPAWTIFIHEVIFDLSRYSFPGFEIDQWFTHPQESDLAETNLHLDRLFVRQLGRQKEIDGEHVAVVLRATLEMACTKGLGGVEGPLTSHLIQTFSAADLNYLDEDGELVLDVPAQLFFLKGVFPAYIERALDDAAPAMFFAPVVVESALNILEQLETRFDFARQPAMEAFGEVVVALMFAAVVAMQMTACDLQHKWPWQWEMLGMLVELCATGCRRWAHLHQTFPSSEAILSLQPLVQSYSLFAYEYASSAANMPCRPSDPAFWAAYPSSRARAAKDFGFVLDEPVLTNDTAVAALRDFAAKDLDAGWKRNWLQVGVSMGGPLWLCGRPGDPARPVDFEWQDRKEARAGLERAIKSLTDALELLGLWGWEREGTGRDSEAGMNE